MKRHENETPRLMGMGRESFSFHDAQRVSTGLQFMTATTKGNMSIMLLEGKKPIEKSVDLVQGKREKSIINQKEKIRGSSCRWFLRFDS